MSDDLLNLKRFWAARRRPTASRPRTSRMAARSILVVIGVIAVVTLWLTNSFATDRFLSSSKNKAEYRLALYAGNIVSELQRNSIVPQLLARDPQLISALNSNDFTQTTQRLISFIDELGAASLILMDKDGRTVAATDRNELGANVRDTPFFFNALRGQGTVFSLWQNDGGGYQFFYSRVLEDQGTPIGVVAVEVDLQKFERAWSGIADAVFVTNSEGTIVLSTEPRWRSKTEDIAFPPQEPQSALDRALQLTGSMSLYTADAYLEGQAMMRTIGRIPFRGWQITSFTAISSVRDQVNGILALEIMFFTLAFAFVLYANNKRTFVRMQTAQKESAELRVLNARLQKEISAREIVQKNLEVAEQSLAQSSKLAALGEMSAAVSHELNQPLAAMKTYLAGAKLLTQRNRTEEASAAFQRIDDLISRMGAITAQLKSYARKGGEGFKAFDIGDAIASSVSMMEPQLRQSEVVLHRVLVDDDVIIMGDRMRLEQVIVNLLRNAIDATKSTRSPEIEIILTKGKSVRLQVRDNGEGISEMDNLFEPFHTTKSPGDGVGLGLAISSGIVSDMGGRLTAHNHPEGGAVFEIELPIFNDTQTETNFLEA